jgi:hypothetical protein
MPWDEVRELVAGNAAFFELLDEFDGDSHCFVNRSRRSQDAVSRRRE